MPLKGPGNHSKAEGDYEMKVLCMDGPAPTPAPTVDPLHDRPCTWQTLTCGDRVVDTTLGLPNEYGDSPTGDALYSFHQFKPQQLVLTACAVTTDFDVELRLWDEHPSTIGAEPIAVNHHNHDCAVIFEDLARVGMYYITLEGTTKDDYGTYELMTLCQDGPTPAPTPMPSSVPTGIPTMVPTPIPTPVPTSIPTPGPTPVPCEYTFVSCGDTIEDRTWLFEPSIVGHDSGDAHYFFSVMSVVTVVVDACFGSEYQEATKFDNTIRLYDVWPNRSTVPIAESHNRTGCSVLSHFIGKPGAYWLFFESATEGHEGEFVMNLDCHTPMPTSVPTSVPTTIPTPVPTGVPTPEPSPVPTRSMSPAPTPVTGCSNVPLKCGEDVRGENKGYPSWVSNPSGDVVFKLTLPTEPLTVTISTCYPYREQNFYAQLLLFTHCPTINFTSYTDELVAADTEIRARMLEAMVVDSGGYGGTFNTSVNTSAPTISPTTSPAPTYGPSALPTSSPTLSPTPSPTGWRLTPFMQSTGDGGCGYISFRLEDPASLPSEIWMCVVAPTSPPPFPSNFT